MTTAKSLKTLLWAKRRRVEQAEAAVQAQQAVLGACRTRQAEAAQHEVDCGLEQQACYDKLTTHCSGEAGFDAADLVTYQHLLDTLKTRRNQAVQVLQQAQQQTAEAEQQLGLLRQAVKRAQQQVEHIEARRQALLQAEELAQEDNQDEESEEAAVARLLAARAQEAASGASHA
ncbi:YscO family type III secretion system apparatus protein [Aquabacterium sp. A7-Y]|uniref:YscO family type III secretion system apparatus protein n=1 Tax=Aquabacterium sp. A7-Y TaxID=1349605 RepID=UPI00223CB671|nr:YscO family type III secretion system apparatus protein [Aquabacterium sp. A7-Y]MCW7540289.1 YscO family type III secretion system apparatus protein [Aquabacterium sp. A7-Y]